MSDVPDTTTPFTRLVGCTHPIQQAAMGGVANVALARAVADAGGLGMLPHPGPELGEQLLDISGHAVGVSFFGFLVDASLHQLELASSAARVVEVFWSDPRDDVVARIHEGGALAAWQVGSVEEARAAADAGCDLLVAQGVEAGGHVRGTTPLLELLDGVVPHAGVPVVAAGGIVTGADLARVLDAGADGARLGTRFVASTEADAHADYQSALVRESATALTTAFSIGWPDAPHRVLASSLASLAGGEGNVFPPRRADREIGRLAMYAGTGVGRIDDVRPAGQIVRDVVAELRRARGR